MVTYLNHISTIEYYLLNSTANSIQSQYYSEGKIYLVLKDIYFEEYIYPRIIKNFRKETYSRYFKLEKSDLAGNDNIDNIEIDFIKGERSEFKIVAGSNYNGINTKTIATGNLVNEIFESNNPYLFSSNINPEDDLDFHHIVEKIFNNIKIDEKYIPNKIYSHSFSDYENISLTMDENKNYELLSYRDSMLYPFVNSFSNKEIFLIVKNKDQNPILSIGGNEELCTKVEINGLIYVEGDILITEDFIFQGIIIIKDGELRIQDDVLVDIKGLLISNSLDLNDLDMENLQITYHKDNIYKYGVFLPNFIEPQILTIKTDY